MKKYNLRVDITRFLLAILVIAIHTGPFDGIKTPAGIFIVQYLGRLAVPLFFALSGYYLHQSIQKSKNPDLTVKKTILNLLKIYLLSWIIYLPLWFYQNRPINLLKFVIDALWAGMHYHLWYFPALIIGILIVYGLSKLKNKSVAWQIVVILYIIGMGLNAYYYLAFEEMPLIYLSRNGLFFAPMFVMIGFYPIYKQNLIALIISLLLYGMEITGLYSLGHMQELSSMYLFLIPVVIFMFPFIIDDTGKTHTSLVFHRLSLSMYIIHPVIVLGLYFLQLKLKTELSSTLIFMVVSVLSIITAWSYQQFRVRKDS